MKRIFALAALLTLFSAPVLAGNHAGQNNFYRPLTMHTMNYVSTTRSITDPLQNSTRFIDVTCTTACFIALEITPVADPISGPNTIFLPANTPRTLVVGPCAGGDCEKVAAIRLSSDGSVYITELGRGPL